MKTIELTQGKRAIVDDADYKWLNQWKWHTLNQNGRHYACRIDTDCRAILMHRLILGLHHRDGLIGHHENGTLDNRRVFLTACTPAEHAKLH